MTQLDLKKHSIQKKCTHLIMIILCQLDFREQIEKWQDCYYIPVRTVQENTMPVYILYCQ